MAGVDRPGERVDRPRHLHPDRLTVARASSSAVPTVATVLRRRPSPGAWMVTRSPARAVKAAGGTMLVPVRSTTPAGEAVGGEQPGQQVPRLAVHVGEVDLVGVYRAVPSISMSNWMRRVSQASSVAGTRQGRPRNCARRPWPAAGRAGSRPRSTGTSTSLASR